MGSGWRSGGNPSAPLLPSGGAYPSVDELPCALQEPAPPPPLTAPLLGTAASAPYSFSPAADAFAADMAVASAQVRAQFVAKVFALLLVQLAFVAGVALLLSSSAPALAASPALLLASAVVAVATTDGLSAGGLAVPRSATWVFHVGDPSVARTAGLPTDACSTGPCSTTISTTRGVTSWSTLSAASRTPSPPSPPPSTVFNTS